MATSGSTCSHWKVLQVILPAQSLMDPFNQSQYVFFKTLQLQLKYPFVQGSFYPGGEHPGEWLESVLDSPE